MGLGLCTKAGWSKIGSVRSVWSKASVVIFATVLVVAATALAFPGVPRVAERILQRDWCSASSYRHAREAVDRAHVKLSPFARRNLVESEQIAREHPAGCRLAVVLTPRRPARTPAHPRWNLGHALASCPRVPVPLGGTWRRQAAGAALAVESRMERPIVIQVGRASAPTTDRAQQLQRACGKKAASRTVIVSLSLSGFYPSASLSERVSAVADFRGWGWRPYLELH
jgi:hypothetical protein